MNKPKAQFIKLKTLDMRGRAPGLAATKLRATRKRVFTNDERAFLNSLPTKDLVRRIFHGKYLINLLYRPEMMNMTPREADKVSSNLRFQIDEIQKIIDSRPKEVLDGGEICLRAME